MKDAQDDAVALQEQMVRTYMNLRIGIALIGAVLPLLLWVGDEVRERHALRPSMSDYYYSLMRDPFVGALVAVGVLLYLYKGFSTLENWALNLAGALAVAVAIVPTRGPDESGGDLRSNLHYTFAILFFLCIAYVCIWRASDTLSLLPERDWARRLRRVYHVLGFTMIVLPLFAASVSGYWWKFFVEAAGVWIFAIYWIVKSGELARTDADLLAVQGRLQAMPPERQKQRQREESPGRLEVLA